MVGAKNYKRTLHCAMNLVGDLYCGSQPHAGLILDMSGRVFTRCSDMTAISVIKFSG